MSRWIVRCGAAGSIATSASRYRGPRHSPRMVGFEIKRVELSPGLLRRIEQDLLMGKMLEQRGEIGERLVKRRHIDIGRLHEMGTNAIDDRMRGFMSDDIV